MKKKVVFVLVSTLCVLSMMCCALLVQGTVSRQKIVNYVNKNYKLLEAFPYEEMPTGAHEQEGFIRSYLGDNTIVKSVDSRNENVLDFFCGGSGLSTGSTYTGFFYSRDDTPCALVFDGCSLEEIETGIYEWQNYNGTHKIRIERIRENWFYYFILYY